MPLREDPTYHVGGLTKNDLSLLLAPLPTLPILDFFLFRFKQNASSTLFSLWLLSLSLCETKRVVAAIVAVTLVPPQRYVSEISQRAGPEDRRRLCSAWSDRNTDHSTQRRAGEEPPRMDKRGQCAQARRADGL